MHELNSSLCEMPWGTRGTRTCMWAHCFLTPTQKARSPPPQAEEHGHHTAADSWREVCRYAGRGGTGGGNRPSPGASTPTQDTSSMPVLSLGTGQALVISYPQSPCLAHSGYSTNDFSSTDSRTQLEKCHRFKDLSCFEKTSAFEYCWFLWAPHLLDLPI